MKKESFLNMCETLEKIEQFCDGFNESMEKTLNKSWDPKYDGDSRVMMLWPLEAIDELLINLICTETNESKEGASWFVYEGMDQIKNGSTMIDDIEIKSYEDYYNYIIAL